MVMIDCLIEVAVFTVYVVNALGMHIHAYTSKISSEQLHLTNLSSGLTWLHTSSKQKKKGESHEWSSVHDSAGFGMVHFEDRTGKIWEMYKQHSFSLSCETAPNAVLQDT